MVPVRRGGLRRRGGAQAQPAGQGRSLRIMSPSHSHESWVTEPGHGPVRVRPGPRTQCSESAASAAGAGSDPEPFITQAQVGMISALARAPGRRPPRLPPGPGVTFAAVGPARDSEDGAARRPASQLEHFPNGPLLCRRPAGQHLRMLSI
jgi:hypothetical protein